ncbi:unnamed protein product [Cyclocybe aegerita]|uniref:Nephrocystin 3-like N-terminal domain-containing protein n=1 Tax=Cyclocybe aegerita TaxID=1973307 RepID=A0A8S0VU11_CYCAE|nr:unnamed protein product [Cyclocybe aegerita]
MANIFCGSQDVMVQNSTFNVTSTTYHTAGTRGFDVLVKAVSQNAFHNSDDRPDPPKCHENTRVAVINKIMDWVTGKIDADAFLLWLYGPAGAGKSAIARTIAELCEKHNLLLASFFFFRSDSGRNTVKPLVASIAYRVACVVPAARVQIDSIIGVDPLILSYSVEAQLKKLVLDPLRILSDQGYFSETPLPPLIVVDGLDECLDRDAQSHLIQVLSSSMAEHRLPLKILVASRPESHIKLAFSLASEQGAISHLELNDDFHPDDDIRRFLTDKFYEVQRSHPFRSQIPSSWPSEEQTKTLMRKASGQFIYASLVVRFVNFARDSPTRSLDIILNLRPPPVHRDLPFAELDALYAFILAGTADVDLALKILGLHFALAEDMQYMEEMDVQEIEVIEALLDLEDGDVRIALSDLSPLLEVAEFYDEGNPYQITFHHSSFPDFLFDHERSKEYHIDMKNMHAVIFQSLLRAFRLHEPLKFRRSKVECIDLTMHMRQLSPPQLVDLHDDLECFSFGAYLEHFTAVLQFFPRPDPIGRGELMDGRSKAFFHVLVELRQDEQYRRHSDLYLSYVTSCIESRSHPESFHALSTVWLVLQSPLRSYVENGTEPNLLPNGVNFSSVWEKLCTSLFDIKRVDCEWDLDHWRLLRPPTDYNDARADIEPLAGIYGDITETLRLLPDSVLSYRLVRLAISCVEYLRWMGTTSVGQRTNYLRIWAEKSKRAPWTCRSRKRLTFVGRQKRITWHKVPWERFTAGWGYSCSQSLLQAHESLYSKTAKSKLFYWKAYRQYMWTLDLLRRTLHVAGGSDDLVAALSKPFIQWPAPILFPRRVRRVRQSMEAYFNRVCSASFPTDADASEGESIANEDGYRPCGSSDDGEYFSCSES